MNAGTDPGTPSERRKRGHASLDAASRNWKAAKIAALLGFDASTAPRRVLEIGAGLGGISRYFGSEGLGWETSAVDVEDVRQDAGGFSFTLVEGVELPFPDASFDVVISNHVIEHVGEADAQRRHLGEMWRVLRPDGVAYLAFPSRWMLVEPHFRLPLLSWLPRPLADAYVRMTGRGTHYDCRPLTVGRIEPQLAAAGWVFEQQHGRAIRCLFEIERPRDWLYRAILKPMPDAVYAAARRAFPTLIYLLRKRPAGAGETA